MLKTPPKITLKAARINAGYTLKSASEAIGVSVATLHSWERDSSSVKVSDVNKIEKTYGYPVEFIFFGNGLEFNSNEGGCLHDR